MEKNAKLKGELDEILRKKSQKQPELEAPGGGLKNPEPRESQVEDSGGGGGGLLQVEETKQKGE